MDMKIHNKQYVIPAEAGIQQVIENCIPNKPLDSRLRALLSGIIFAELVHTAARVGFAHASTTIRLKFSRPLKHRHSGMFWQARRIFSGQQCAVARMMV